MPKFYKDSENSNIVHVSFTEEEQSQMPSQPIDENVIIRRYMNYDKFSMLITDKYLWFCRIDKFSDQHEGRAIIDWQTETGHENNGWLDYWRKFVLASCWNKDEMENFALWNIYLGKEKEGIAIETTISKTMNSINDNSKINFWNIEYVNYGINYEGINHLICATRKYDWYSYENELRFIYYTGEQFEVSGKEIEIDLHQLINKIILSPNRSDEFKIKIEKLLKDNGLEDIEIVDSLIQDKIYK